MVSEGDRTDSCLVVKADGFVLFRVSFGWENILESTPDMTTFHLLMRVRMRKFARITPPTLDARKAAEVGLEMVAVLKNRYMVPVNVDGGVVEASAGGGKKWNFPVKFRLDLLPLPLYVISCTPSTFSALDATCNPVYGCGEVVLMHWRPGLVKCFVENNQL